MRILLVILVLLLAIAPAVVAIENDTKQPGPFTDVLKDHWSYKAIEQLQKDGYIIGYPDNVICVAKPLMTRYEFAVAVARVITLPLTVGENTSSSREGTEQVSPSPSGNQGKQIGADDAELLLKLYHEFSDELDALGVSIDALKKDMELTGDTKQGMFIRLLVDSEHPKSEKESQSPSISNTQTPVPFSDVPKGHWAYEAVKQLKEAGILTGYPNSKFEGNKPVTRNDFAVAIARMLPMIKSISESTNATRQQMDDLERRVSALEQGEVAPKTAPAAPPADTPTKAEVESISNLISEFAVELHNMRVNVDALKKDVAALKDRVAAAEKESKPLK